MCQAALLVEVDDEVEAFDSLLVEVDCDVSFGLEVSFLSEGLLSDDVSVEGFLSEP